MKKLFIIKLFGTKFSFTVPVGFSFGEISEEQLKFCTKAKRIFCPHIATGGSPPRAFASRRDKSL